MRESAAFLAGGLLGAFFFGGLWLTVQKGLNSVVPGLWFLVSMVVRTAVVLVGFYSIAPGGWQPMLAALIGFAVSRTIVTWRTGAVQGAHISKEMI